MSIALDLRLWVQALEHRRTDSRRIELPADVADLLVFALRDAAERVARIEAASVPAALRLLPLGGNVVPFPCRAAPAPSGAA